MTSSLQLFTFLLAVVTLVAGLAYRRAWIRMRGDAVTPTGFGALLALALLAASLVFQLPTSISIAFGIIAGATALYWLDDLQELSARLRMAVSFATGVAICWLLLKDNAGIPVWLMVLACALAGGVNVVLTNIINFYDGADLNLATVIALTAIGLLWLAGDSREMVVSAMACLGFIAPFAIMNSRPKTIYLGDAGSFAFACLLTMMTVICLREPGGLTPAVAVPLALPAFDTFYVFCVRMIEKHDLLTRNYLHLYQKLNTHRPGFVYLAPQVVNAVLVLGVFTLLQKAGVNLFLAVLIAGAGVTIPFYFLCRRFLLPRSAQAAGS
ncbi:MAG: hypothetical protein IBJ02_07205 [Brevundimonas sp.]|nr:hypothetical protein [Brevundimonas sp.]